MGPSLTNMLPRLHAVIQSGLEPHLSLKVLQYCAVLLGPQAVEPLATVLPEILVNLTKCIHSEQQEGDDEAMDDSGGKDRGVTTTRNAIAALCFADSIMQAFPDLGASICSPVVQKVVAALPGKALAEPLLSATFSSFGRLLWMKPIIMEELFVKGYDQNQEKNVAALVNAWISVVTSVSVLVMLSAQAQKIAFMNQKAAALSLCSAVCRSPLVARVSGREVLNFTKQLLEIESRTKVNLDDLVEAACGTARKVVGDGPLGDISLRTAEISKSDPLLIVGLAEALGNAEKAVASA